MSVDSAKEFLERVRNDEDFRKSVGEIVTTEERMEFVKGAGLDFTKDEIKSILDELSDAYFEACGRMWSEMMENLIKGAGCDGIFSVAESEGEQFCRSQTGD